MLIKCGLQQKISVLLEVQIREFCCWEGGQESSQSFIKGWELMLVLPAVGDRVCTKDWIETSLVSADTSRHISIETSHSGGEDRR